ncbi:MAG: hypothetical protein GY862_17795 [Gammaproteobacteria bacterium]|nr:hypothetical protein [Gammaproteobacteria bacterium]
MSAEGAVRTLAHEVRNEGGELLDTWSEYIDATLREVNDRHAKKILLFLSKDRYSEHTRPEIAAHLGGALDDAALDTKLRALEYGDLIARPGASRFRYCGIPDDILDLIFRDLYQEEIDGDTPDIESELAARVAALEKEKKSLVGALNELKGRMLELIVSRELNKCRKEHKPLPDFKRRFRPALEARHSARLEKLTAACETSLFDAIWVNYYLQAQGTGAVETDVLAQGSDAEKAWALLFEIKNRDEKNPPSMNEARDFTAKIEKVKLYLAQTGKTPFVCPIYLSATGFKTKVETWLHEQGVLTTDREHWETVKQAQP